MCAEDNFPLISFLYLNLVIRARDINFYKDPYSL